MVKEKREINFVYCSPSDYNVGISSHCEKIKAEIYPNKVIFNQVDKSKHSLFTFPNKEPLSKNLVSASDERLEKEFRGYFEDTKYDTFVTEKNYNKILKYKEEENEKDLFRTLGELSSKEREKYFRSEFKGDPKEREAFKKKYYDFKTK